MRKITDITSVDVALQQLKYHVLADGNIPDEEACNKEVGAVWMNLVDGRCMRLMYQDGSANVYWPANEKQIKAVTDTYKIDLKQYCTCRVVSRSTNGCMASPFDG